MLLKFFVMGSLKFHRLGTFLSQQLIDDSDGNLIYDLIGKGIPFFGFFLPISVMIRGFSFLRVLLRLLIHFFG